MNVRYEFNRLSQVNINMDGKDHWEPMTAASFHEWHRNPESMTRVRHITDNVGIPGKARMFYTMYNATDRSIAEWSTIETYNFAMADEAQARRIQLANLTRIPTPVLKSLDDMPGIEEMRTIPNAAGPRELTSYSVEGFFGLSRGAYAVLPRKALRKLSPAGQEAFITLMIELDAVYKDEAPAGYYQVTLRDSTGRFITDPWGDYRHD